MGFPYPDEVSKKLVAMGMGHKIVSNNEPYVWLGSIAGVPTALFGVDDQGLVLPPHVWLLAIATRHRFVFARAMLKVLQALQAKYGALDALVREGQTAWAERCGFQPSEMTVTVLGENYRLMEMH